MATQPTQNPVPSESPRDLKFNAGKIDEFVNSFALQYIDRFGNAHYTIEGLKSLILQAIYNLGLNPVGTFQAGATLTSANDIIQDTSTQVWYRWDSVSTLPKTVPAGSTPASTGGIGAGKWQAVDVTDVLRRDLAKEGGVRLVNGALAFEDDPRKPITLMDSYDPQNVTAAWVESIQKYGYVYFPASVPTTYTAYLAGQITSVLNSIIFADDLVTIATDYRDYDFYRSIKMHGRAKFFILGEKYSFYAKDIPLVQQQASLDYNPVEMEPIPFNLCKTYSIPANSDAFNAAGAITSYTHGAQASVPANSLTGIYTQIDIGETISAHVTTTLNTAERVGMIVRCSNGYYYISKNINTTGGWQATYKQRGGAYQGPVVINMPDNNLLSYTAGKAAIGIMVQSKNSFMFTMNGVSTGLPFKTGTLGEIMEVGFVASTVAQADVLKITGLHAYRSAHGVLGKPPIDIAFYGDSEVADFVASFTKYMPGLIDGRMGTRTVAIGNAAVAGQSFGQQLAFLKANPPGAQIVCMVAGTNEAQGGISADFFVNTVKDFCDFCIGRGQTPMWVEPWMWYPKEFTNGNGQTTIGNYDNAAELREAGKRIMASYGDQAICVTTTHQLPAPLPKYTNDYPNIDPLLRDNLHQSELSNRLYAEIVASALLKWLVKVDKTPASLPDWYLGQFITTTNSRISKGLLSGTFGATTALSNNVILCQLPRWNIPGYQLDAPVTWFNSTSNTYGAGRLSISTTGEVRVYGASGATLIYVHAKW